MRLSAPLFGPMIQTKLHQYRAFDSDHLSPIKIADSTAEPFLGGSHDLIGHCFTCLIAKPDDCFARKHTLYIGSQRHYLHAVQTRIGNVV
jgi:hypothetical protein